MKDTFGICAICSFDFNKVEVKKGQNILINCECRTHMADITLFSDGVKELNTTAF